MSTPDTRTPSFTDDEMQAIRKAFRSLLVEGDVDFLWWTLKTNAPHVHAWVLEDR